MLANFAHTNDEVVWVQAGSAIHLLQNLLDSLLGPHEAQPVQDGRKILEKWQ